MRAAQEDFELQRIQLLKVLREILLQFLLDFVLGSRRLGFPELDHYLEIFQFLFRLEQRFDLVPKGIGFLNELLGLFAIIPEIVRRHQSVELAQALLRARYIKETSADARVCPSRSSIRL